MKSSKERTHSHTHLTCQYISLLHCHSIHYRFLLRRSQTHYSCRVVGGGGIFMYITKTMKISFSLSLFSIAKNEILKRTHTLIHTTYMYMSVHLTPTLPLDTLQIPSSPISDTLQLQGGGGGGGIHVYHKDKDIFFFVPLFHCKE